MIPGYRSPQRNVSWGNSPASANSFRHQEALALPDKSRRSLQFVRALRNGAQTPELPPPGYAVLTSAARPNASTRSGSALDKLAR